MGVDDSANTKFLSSNLIQQKRYRIISLVAIVSRAEIRESYFSGHLQRFRVRSPVCHPSLARTHRFKAGDLQRDQWGQDIPSVIIRQKKALSRGFFINILIVFNPSLKKKKKNPHSYRFMNELVLEPSLMRYRVTQLSMINAEFLMLTY